MALMDNKQPQSWLSSRDYVTYYTCRTNRPR